MGSDGGKGRPSRVVSSELPARPPVDWEGVPDPGAWHVDSSLPAAEALSDLPQPIEEEPPEAKSEDEQETLEAVPEAEEEYVPTDSGRRRSKTIARKQMLRERRRMVAHGTLPEILDYERPMTRADCRDAKRPCLYVSCRYHLYLDVNPVTGSIKINFPDKEPWELESTCALDVAGKGGITLEEVGEIMNLTRERIRQVEVSGLDKLRAEEDELETFLDGRELSDPGGEENPGSPSLPVLND